MTEVTTTPAEAGVRWLVAALERRDRLTLEEVRDAYDTSGWDPRWSIEGEYEELRREVPVVLPLTVMSITTSGPHEATALVVAGDDKRWAISSWVQEAPPHKLTGARIVPAPPDGTVIRDARPDEGPVLAELERRSPLRLGDTLVVFDRGEDYFASARLMEDVTIYVAEVDGALAGVYWGARQPVRVGGADKLLFLEHHVRIDPVTRRGGVFWALCVYGRDRYARTTDSIAFYVSPQNHAVRKFVENVPSWSVQAERALIPCVPAAAGAEVGRWATAADAAEVVGVLNGCHGSSELFVPYTAASLGQRLGRDPGQYGWGSLRVAGGAVVGVGGDRLGVVHERDGERRQTRRAIALDHGVAAGAEEDYRALLGWWASRLAAEGVTHLAVFTSVGSPTREVVLDLAEYVEPFDLWTFSIDEPPGVAERGLYVDPVYF